MTPTPNAESFTLTPPTLPKSGGSLQGMATTPGAIGPDGQASLAIALPLSPGRGYAPALGLLYQSGSGNDVFGSGWHCAVPTIRRDTRRGAPAYSDQDRFLDPDGEVLVPECDAQGRVVTTTTATFGTQALDRAYRVTRYLPRVETSFTRIERWQSAGVADFWLLHRRSGELLCLGKTAQARISDPADPQQRVARWLAEESVSPTGEHIYYRYISAAEAGIKDPGGRDAQSQRVLHGVHYGNVCAAADLWIWQDEEAPAKQAWLFSLVLDYGARGTDSNVPPPFTIPDSARWPVRQDPFSTYDAGFEIRTHLLCRQVLMFHHFPAELGADATLVQRLLLSYDENPLLSRLAGAQTLAYEPDPAHTLQCLPPLELDYSTFHPPSQANAWQPLELPGTLGLTAYNLVDLYGEGIPGLLYQTPEAWYYRAAQRDAAPKADADAVVFGELCKLPQIPSLQSAQHVALLDINGDGRLEWLITQADGLVGYYSLAADHSWSGFTPLTGFPVEYLHPHATLTDVRGTGRPDLAMIGPRSVRLYVNEGGGFNSTKTTTQNSAITLPAIGTDARELVVFCDMLGSGQLHLASVRHDCVKCWPNLGDGRFASPITFAISPPLDPARFNPRQVFLADLDGSGAADLIYADSHGIQLFFNQAGNAFAPPMTLPYPSGVTYDPFTQLHVVDLAGQGTVSLVLTQPPSGLASVPRHWRCDLSTRKPYLLSSISNNCGATTHLTFRSAAQEWLDEKQAVPTAIPGVPFPMLVLSCVAQHDQFSDHSLTQRHLYRRGYWDPVEREFRGFGYCETCENYDVPGEPAAVPLRTCRWYHTGRAEDDRQLFGAPFKDTDAFAVPAPRLTQWQGSADDGHDQPFNPDAATEWWMHRALKGSQLREEHYGLDGSAAATIPYEVRQSRCHARLVQAGQQPVVLRLDGGSNQYRYERVATDPQVSQDIPLAFDTFGHSLWRVSAVCPRRLNADSANPYSATALPASAWPATFDPQQTLLRLTETRTQVRNQADAQAWLLGVPLASRQNVLTYAAEQSPPAGLTVEALLAADGLLGARQVRELIAQQQHHYVSDPALPKTLALLDHNETALLTANDLNAYASVLTETQCEQLLRDGGYHSMPALLPATGAAAEQAVWAGNTDYRTYLGAEQFWRIHTNTAAQLSAPDGTLPVQTLTWDAYCCCLEKTADAYGNTTGAAIDYRFLAPWQITDLNDNNHEAQRDALGRVIATTLYGTELAPDNVSAIAVGFDPLHTSPVPSGQTVQDAVAQALAINQGNGKQQVASRAVYAMFSQMGQLDVAQLRPLVTDAAAADALFQQLIALRFITSQGHVLTRGWRWANDTVDITGVPSSLRPWLLALTRQPMHNAVLIADAYPASRQQISVQISHSDGAGRPLQTATLQPAGLAYQRDAYGAFVLTEGRPLESTANPRWAITDRVEYSPRGQLARVYQPYFINEWLPITDCALHANVYADTHYFDATGRETHVVTASGWLRRDCITPWFTVHEDENDTAAEHLSTEAADD